MWDVDHYRTRCAEFDAAVAVHVAAIQAANAAIDAINVEHRQFVEDYVQHQVEQARRTIPSPRSSTTPSLL